MNEVASGEIKTSRYLLNAMVKEGLLIKKEIKEKAGRDRGKTVWELSGKGRGRLALAARNGELAKLTA